MDEGEETSRLESHGDVGGGDQETCESGSTVTGNRGSGPPLVSAIVINWNTRDHLNECLASLLSGGGSSELEVIAVDNNAPDGSAEMVRQKFPSVTLIENDRNLIDRKST